MATPEKNEDGITPVPDALPEAAGPASDELALHRPDEDIAHRPHLKVRPIGSRPADPGKPAVRGGTLFRAQPKPEATPEPEALAESQDQPAAKKVALPAPEETEARYAYATHRPPPADAKAEKEVLAALTGTKPEREVPTALVLGVALIVVALLSGVFIVRLTQKVGAIERRMNALEGPARRAVTVRPRTAAARPAPAVRTAQHTTRANTASARVR